jgi:hypothetical protein
MRRHRADVLYLYSRPAHLSSQSCCRKSRRKVCIIVLDRFGQGGALACGVRAGSRFLLSPPDTILVFSTSSTQPDHRSKDREGRGGYRHRDSRGGRGGGPSSSHNPRFNSRNDKRKPNFIPNVKQAPATDTDAGAADPESVLASEAQAASIRLAARATYAEDGMLSSFPAPHLHPCSDRDMQILRQRRRR